MNSFQNKIVSFHILERRNNKNYIRWTYPTITEDLRQLLLAHCFQTFPEEGSFVLRNGPAWAQIHQFTSDDGMEAVVLITNEFDPGKYKRLCTVFSEAYRKTSNPVEIVKLYLNLFTRGSCSFQENGKVVLFDAAQYKSESAIKVKDLINTYGMEIILIYSMILLKKRLVFYHADAELLQEVIFTATFLVPQRTETYQGSVHPFVTAPNQLKDLQSSFYIAGVSNRKFREISSTYDVHVDLVTKEITISPSAKDDLILTKVHKDLARFLVALGESDKREEEVVTEIKTKTSVLLQQLESLAAIEENKGKSIRIEDLKSRGFSAALEGFLVQLAAAENMVIIS